MKGQTRRQFIAAAGCLGTEFTVLPAIGLAQAGGGEDQFVDYRALVAVLLFGGNDSFNMVVPRSAAEYRTYAASRRGLAVPLDALLPILPGTSGGAFGVHPSAGRLKALFDRGRAAFITNIGPLLEPLTLEQYLNDERAVPPQLFSHSDQLQQWLTLGGAAQGITGWAGRIADLIRRVTEAKLLPTCISLHGNSVFLSGLDTVAYSLGVDGPLEFYGLQRVDPHLRARRAAFERILSFEYSSLYAKAYAEVHHRGLQVIDQLTGALGMAPPIVTPFPSTALGQQLAMVARLIAIRDELQMQRQVFLVGMGGFDTHDFQTVRQPKLMNTLSEALGAFYDATVELGVAEKVVTFTQSEFGRTLTSNGDGTDHGWGGIQVVVGDAVQGGRFYGEYPILEIGGPQDVGGGRLLPTISTDQYAATLARWFGVSEADIEVVAPNLGKFQERHLGFLA